MDQRAREGERRARALQGDAAEADAAAAACHRAGRPVPFEVLISTTRWRRVAGFVARWYRRPLEPAAPLVGPGALRASPSPALAEALLLLNRPALLGELLRVVEPVVEAEMVSLFQRPGGEVFGVPVEGLAAEDPVVWVRPRPPFDPRARHPVGPLSEVVLSLVVYANVFVVPSTESAARRWGRMARVLPWSRPGSSPDDLVTHLRASYQVLPLPFRQAHAAPDRFDFLGDAETLLFLCGPAHSRHCYVTARTERAWTRLLPWVTRVTSGGGWGEVHSRGPRGVWKRERDGAA